MTDFIVQRTLVDTEEVIVVQKIGDCSYRRGRNAITEAIAKSKRMHRNQNP